MNKIISGLVIILVILVLFFSPNIDPFVAKLALTEDGGFYGMASLVCSVIYDAVTYLAVLCCVIPVLLCIYNWRNPLKSAGVKKSTAIVLLAMILGPWIMVNASFKEHWGRPRPYQIYTQEAPQKFQPFWQHVANQPQNNSFPSGHASIGFFLGVPLMAFRRRKTAVVVSIAGGVIVGAVRILQGGHFVSDVIMAGVFVWLGYLIAKCTVNLVFRKFSK